MPLHASDTSVAAFMRMDADRPVLVVVNLSGAPRRGVRLSSDERVLPRGRHVGVPLLGTGSVPPIRVDRDGRIAGYAPAEVLAPLSAAIVELRRP